MINGTSERVSLNTNAEVNERIHSLLERRMVFYAEDPELIEQRLSELDQEWDVERLIESEAPTLTMAGMLMGVALGRKWLLLPLFAQGMVLLHALHGWYPLLPLFRRLGFRTPREIATERYALKALRGDFKSTGQQGGSRGERVFQAASPATG